MKPSNYEENLRDRRLAKNQNGKRKVVVVAREKGGQTVTKAFNSEAAGVAGIASVIELGSTVHADEAPHWDALHDRFVTKRINHEWAYSDEGACTNDDESFFSRVRRAEIGIHHHIAGPYFAAYVAEMAWREETGRLATANNI